MPADQTLTQDEVLGLFDEVSNWGRWGDDDERGTLNYITPEQVRSAARLVRSGRVVSIAHDLDTLRSAKNANPVVHRVFEPRAPHFGTSDELTISPHGYALTHLDAVNGNPYQGRIYNGRRFEEAFQKDGAHFASVYTQRDGIVTRGVLLDVAAARGVDYLEREDTVTIADLDNAEGLSGLRVTTGDAVFVRAGVGLREVVQAPEDVSVRTGLGPECTRWLHQREVSVFGSDCSEKIPSGYIQILLPFHQITRVAMGLILLDNAAMEPLARACAEEGRNEFMFMAAPLRIPKGTGCAVNPLGLF